MSNNTLKAMNDSLYAASFHLLEASKHLSNIEEWRGAAIELLERAQLLANVIKVEPEKISIDKVNDILDEILSFDNSLSKDPK